MVWFDPSVCLRLASGSPQVTRLVCIYCLSAVVYLVLTAYSGSDDGSIKFWEVCSARCVKTVQVGGAVKSIAWNPNPSLCLLAVAL